MRFCKRWSCCAGLLPMRTPPFATDDDGRWGSSAPASPSHADATPAPLLHDAEAVGPSEELVEALCSLPQLPTLPVTTVR